MSAAATGHALDLKTLVEYARDECPPSQLVQRLIAEGRLEAAADRYWMEICATIMGLTPVEYQRRYMPEDKRERFTQRVVYYISTEPTPKVGASVKIGVALDVKARLSAIQSGSPVPVYLLATEAGAISRERQIHEMFAADRQRGEWFFVSHDLADYIRGIQ